MTKQSWKTVSSRLRRLSVEAPPHTIRRIRAGPVVGVHSWHPEPCRLVREKLHALGECGLSRPTSSTGAAAAPHDVERGHASGPFRLMDDWIAA